MAENALKAADGKELHVGTKVRFRTDAYVIRDNRQLSLRDRTGEVIVVPGTGDDEDMLVVKIDQRMEELANTGNEVAWEAASRGTGRPAEYVEAAAMMEVM